MSLSLSKAQRLETIGSLRRFFSEKIDHELSDLQAGFLLDYLLKEIAPFAYNQGVEDAQKHLLRLAEDLPGTCFEEPMTYWNSDGGAQGVRRKPKI